MVRTVLDRLHTGKEATEGGGSGLGGGKALGEGLGLGERLFSDLRNSGR